MNYDFLQSYNIPIARRSNENQYASSSQSTMEGSYGAYSMQSTQSTPAVNTAYYGYGSTNIYNDGYQKPVGAAGGNSSKYQNPNRFIPPFKHGTGYTPHKTPFKRKHNSVGGGGSAAKKEVPIVEVTNDGKLVMFLGRDETYPDDLNSLIHPLSCDLCDIKMNSRAIAKIHYESKSHDKHISSWLFKNYTEKGINPPTVKRFFKQGPTGPEAFYCEACDLKLTSITHANQHYAGKKHCMVIAQRAKPSGPGFYNSEGKWVRTGTKGTPNPYKDNNFGIGETFQIAKILISPEDFNNKDNPASENTNTITSVADTTTNENDGKDCTVDTTKPSTTNTTDQDPALFCSICKVSVTSAVQMTMHLSGSKHMKKLKLAGLDPTALSNTTEAQSDIMTTASVVDNVLFSAIKESIKPDPTDLSMYRTPSGQYYCKTCNTSMSHLPGLEQHLKGKRHLRKLTEERAMASLAAKKTLKK